MMSGKYSGNQFFQAANLKSKSFSWASCPDVVAKTVTSFLAYHL